MVFQPDYDKLWDIVDSYLSCSGHDLDHVRRVEKIALELAEGMDLDMVVLRSSVILHDIARVIEDEDPTRKVNHAELGAKMARGILIELGYPEDTVSAIVHSIRTHRFRGKVKAESLEAQVLFDADKLDVLGAIGIARSFMIAGQMGEPMYRDIGLEEYISENLSNGDPDGIILDFNKHASNLEFEIKFRRIPSKLYTERAKHFAEEKIGFMETFYSRLGREVKGKLV